MLSTTLTVAAAPGAAARPTGAPVEVLSERSETTEVFANPNGTFTLREYLRPIWAKTAGGSWVRPDATLRQLDDGSIAPVASTFAMTFSGGGTAPFATAAREGTELVLGWPGRLPAPALRDNIATYPEVLPGVDLEVHAEVDGFTHVLVVKNRAAAANPALRKLALTTRTKNLVLAVDPTTGAVSAKNDKGKVVLGGATPTMWDSAAGQAGAEGGSGGEPSHERVIPAAVRPGVLELVPDATLLTGPDVVYPVRIDPSFTGRRNHWTVLRKEAGGTSYYDRLTIGDDDAGAGVLRVGRNDVGNTARTLIELDTSGVAGKHIFSARLSVWHAWSGKGCGNGNPFTPTNIRVHPTYGFDSGTTWNTWWNGDLSGWGGALSGDGGYLRRYKNATGCPGPGTQEFDVTAAVGNGGGPVTLGLMAESESYQFSWKRYFMLGDRFDSRNPYLTIDFNSVPYTPDTLDTDGKGCATGSGRPWVGTVTPKLRARASDADPETDLAVYFDWVRIQADGTYGPVLGTRSQGSLASGATAEVPLPPLDQDGLYAWRSRAHDGDEWSASYSGWCEFGIDTVRPANTPVVSSPLYKDDLIERYGSIGKTADFTFAANGVSDVAGYEYGWNDPPTTYVPTSALGGSVTRALTPPPLDAGDPTRGGQLTLYVHSLDRAGNRSPLTRYTFLIASASSPAGEWKLNETSGTTLADSSGYEHPAALSGGTLGTTGHLVGEPAVSFNGTADYAATTDPVLDTGTSFSVAAWVKLTNASGTYQTMVSQIGSRASAFYLQKFENTWALSMAASDADAPTGFHAQSSFAPAVGVWTHLAGVYDRDGGTLRLYVNGVLAGSATGAGSFNATGPLWIGRARYAGQSVDQFAGAISGVRVWDRVLQPAEVAPMGATQVGWWKLDGNGYDDSGQGRDATPANVTWTTDRLGNPTSAGAFNGSARLATAGPALYTDQSFTVSARVRITDLSLYERTAVAQEGNSVAAFYLGLRQDSGRPQWSMQLRPYDEGVCCPWAAVGGTAKPGDWQHLVGVYDAAAARVRLYVDNVKVADVGTGTLWNSTGPLSIGFGKWAPGGDFWAGGLDDVHVYQGVLPDSEITKLYIG